MGAVSARTFWGGAKYYTGTSGQSLNLSTRLWVFNFTTGGLIVTAPQLQYCPRGYRLFIVANNGGSTFTLRDGDGGSFMSVSVAANKVYTLSTCLIAGSLRWAFEPMDWSTN